MVAAPAAAACRDAVVEAVEKRMRRVAGSRTFVDVCIGWCNIAIINSAQSLIFYG